MMDIKSLFIEPKHRIECVCPNCGEIHKKLVEPEYIQSRWACKRGKRLLISCPACILDILREDMEARRC